MLFLLLTSMLRKIGLSGCTGKLFRFCGQLVQLVNQCSFPCRPRRRSSLIGVGVLLVNDRPRMFSALSAMNVVFLLMNVLLHPFHSERGSLLLLSSFIAG